MNILFLMILVSLPSFALVDKSKIVPELPPEEIIEHTKEKSKLKMLELDVETVLHYREPVLLPDQRVLELNYFSHKEAANGPRQSSLGLKISSENKISEIIVINQTVNSKSEEVISVGELDLYKIIISKIIFNESITLTLSNK